MDFNTSMNGRTKIYLDNDTGNYFTFIGNSEHKYFIPELEQLANMGNPIAQCAMGDYYNTNTQHADYRKAFEWYEKAANQAYAEALFNLSNFYVTGMGVVEIDFDKAVTLMEESAKQGFIDAMFHLGMMYSTNDEYNKAIYWLEKADNAGHSETHIFLKTTKLLSDAINLIP